MNRPPGQPGTDPGVDRRANPDAAGAAGDLAARLRLMVITDPNPACGRDLIDVVAECIDAGATAIELRDKRATDEALLTVAESLVPLVRGRGRLLVINDRMDVALAAGADGVHLGPADLPVAAARAIAPAGFLIGYSTDDPEVAAGAARDGADYLGVGAVFGTRSKPGLEDERIGPERVGQVLRAAGLPGVGIGGITAQNAGELARAGVGVAVLSAVMGAARPADTVRAILGALREPPRGP
jgi:thiamine-phosphate diphosphorylase